jgi:hypothetical protein
MIAMKDAVAICLAFLVAAIVAGVGTPVLAQVESWALYDDFSGATLNPNKWLSLYAFALGGDVNRIALAGTLRMRFVGYGLRTSDTDRMVSKVNLILISSASPALRQLRARVLVANQGTRGCATNPGWPTQIVTGLFGDFFRDGGVPVYAQIRLRRLVTDASDTFRVEALTCRSDDELCATGEVFSSHLGSVPMNTWTTISLIWDRPNRRFIYQWDSHTPVTHTYTWSDDTPPAPGIKSLDVRPVVPNCTSGDRPFAFATVRFDDVYVNESAATPPPLRAPAVQELLRRVRGLGR